MIPAKVFLIYLGLFGDQNSFQIVAAGQKPMNRSNIFNENRCVIGVLSYFYRFIWINLNTFYFPWALNYIA